MKISKLILVCMSILTIGAVCYAANMSLAPATAQPVVTQSTAPSLASAPVTNTPIVESVEIAHVQQPDAILAKVIDVEPIYVSKLVPHRTCRMERRTVWVPDQRAIPGSGTIGGGAAGAIIGNRIGKGNGNIAATIGGAVLGSIIGTNIENEMNRPYPQDYYVRVCHTHMIKESHLKGYTVTYLVNGKAKTTFMKKKPVSDEIRLELSPVSNS